MKQEQKNQTAPRPDPAAADPRSHGGKGSRRVQSQEPKEPHYDPSGRWTERPDAALYHEEDDKARQRFARGAEWDFRPDGDSKQKKQH